MTAVAADVDLPFSVQGARRAPTPDEIRLIEPGCTVWALNLEWDTDADADQVKGGVVFSIESELDEETGEVQRRFITATPWRGRIRFDVVGAGEVRQVMAPNPASMRTLLRKAGEIVGRSGKRMSTDVARCVTLQAKLMEVL